MFIIIPATHIGGHENRNFIHTCFSVIVNEPSAAPSEIRNIDESTACVRVVFFSYSICDFNLTLSCLQIFEFTSIPSLRKQRDSFLDFSVCLFFFDSSINSSNRCAYPAKINHTIPCHDKQKITVNKLFELKKNIPAIGRLSYFYNFSSNSLFG